MRTYTICYIGNYLTPPQSNDPLVQFEFEEIKAAINFDKNVAANIGWTALFKTPGNRRRLRIIIALALFGEWSGNDLV